MTPPTVTPIKPWYQSRTIWANFVVVATAGLAAVYQFLPQLQGQLDASTYQFLLFLTGAGNVFLRAITNSGITK